MRGIKNQKDFEKALKNYVAKKDITESNYILSRSFLGNALTEDLLIIENFKFDNLYFEGIRFETFQFKNCIFKDCSFNRDVSIGACIFNGWKFDNTRIDAVHFSECDCINTVFHNCIHTNNIFGDCLFRNAKLIYSKEMIEIYFGNCRIEELEFSNCYVTISRFQDITEETTKIIFSDCILELSYFYNVYLKNSNFIKTALNQNSFNNCSQSSNTFAISTKSTAKEFSSIDFQTIINSSNLNENVLNQCFGVHASDIKDYIFSLTQKIEFQSVFISYSFKDKEFAKRLNSSLLSKGVITFLWEKDAPPGKTLNKIMKENVKKHDRILFIASVNSIRSKACHFELTEGRNKQSEFWTEIFFPIHIDNYLFEVEKIDIKPVYNQDEYWQNRTELREINSMDFSLFIADEYNHEEYDNMIFKLVRELKK